MSDKGSINNITLPVYKKLKGEIEEGLATKADKVTIDGVKVIYDEPNDITHFVFQDAIGLLSITLNTHTLFFKDGVVVDENGEEVEGYELDDYYIVDEKTYLDLIGDLSEQVINGFVYYNVAKSGSLIGNTYNLYFPQPSGTKLYRHNIDFGSGSLIINSATNELVNSKDKLNALLSYYGCSYIVYQGNIVSIISFSYIQGPQILTLYIINSTGTVSSIKVDSVSDTVTEL